MNQYDGHRGFLKNLELKRSLTVLNSLVERGGFLEILLWQILLKEGPAKPFSDCSSTQGNTGKGLSYRDFSPVEAAKPSTNRLC